MKKRRLMALSLAAVMALTTACSVQTRDSAQGTQAGGSGQAAAGNTSTAAGSADLTLLFMSSNEEAGNVVRDQLSKAGFNVKLNMQPDYSSYKSQIEAGNYDIQISGWTTVTGNPDYAVRALFITGGDSNDQPLSDPKVDELINKAATETPEDYVATYAELEKYMVEEQAYIIPLFQNTKSQGVYTKKVDPDSVRISKSRSMVWETIDFSDGSDPETETLITQQSGSAITSLDPIKGNDGTMNMLSTNMYVRLVNLTDDDQVVADGSLSYNYSIAEGNSDYYFILRDDINFARVEDGHAVDSGVKVAGEDVIFSLNRAKNKDSVPNHQTYSLHEHIADVQMVRDMAELEGTTVSGSDMTIREALENGLAAPIATLVDNKDSVDNAAGAYQVIKVTTTEPFPQVLNYLAHQSAGIVDSVVVEEVNSTYDVATYDVSKDICYGDQSTITEGSSYNNTLSCSGPYVAIKKNDYEITFERNPAYMPGTDNYPHIKNISVKFIADADSALSALRSGEIHVLYSVPEKSYDIVENDANLRLQTLPSNGVSYIRFNLLDGAQTTDATLRKAVSAAINQDELLAVFDGTRFPLYSTLSPMVDTGNTFTYTAGKSQELLNEYLSSKQ